MAQEQGVAVWTNDAILGILDEERLRYPDRDEVLIKGLILLLKGRGVYPQEPVKGTVERMVEFWGAYWHVWQGTLNCPHCHSDQRDLKAGPPFMRTLACIANDRLAYHQCPDCRGTF